MSQTLDRIIEEVRQLAPDERRQLREMLDREPHPLTSDSLTPEQARRAALIRSIRGKYAHLPTSSDDFAARKAEEIALEDRRDQS